MKAGWFLSSAFRLLAILSFFKKLSAIHILLFILGITLVAPSCVPNKKIVYLQNKERYTGFPKDSVISHYDLYDYQYNLQPQDIITISIASLTSEEYDFYRDYIRDLGPLVRTPEYPGSPGQGRGGNQSGGNNQGGGRGQNNRGGSLGAEFMVDSTGKVRLPVMGKVQVGGLTLDEAEQAVEEHARGYFEDPMVRMNIQNFQITILGEVNQEGMITIRDPEVNIYEALSLAGNMTEMADRTNVKIVRKDGKQANTRYVNLLQEEMLASQNLFLRPGDMIIVPPLKAKERKEYILPAYRTALSVISTTLVFILTIDRLTNLGN